MPRFICLGAVLFVVFTSVTKAQTSADCLICSWPTRPPTQAAEICEDLATASCENENGTSRYAGKLKQLEEKMKILVSLAKDKTAAALGYKSSEEATLRTIETAGLKLKSDLSKSAKNYVLYGDYSDYVQASEIYDDMAQCQKDQSSIQNMSPDYYNLKSIESAIKSADDFYQKYDQIRIKAYALNLSKFMMDLGQKCKALNDQSKKMSADQIFSDTRISSLAKTCAESSKLRKAATQLFREQEAVDYQSRSLKFVESAFAGFDASTTEVKTKMETTSPTSSPSARTSPLTAAVDLWVQKRSGTYTTCYSLGNSLDAAVKTPQNEISKKLSLGRPTVEFLIDSVYTSERKTKLNQYIEMIKVEALNVASRLPQDRAKLKKIADTYHRITLTWLDKPQDSAYSADSLTKVQILEPQKLTPIDPLSNVFNDRSLSFFTSMNAFYQPDISYGELHRDLNLNIMPLFIEMFDENPYGFLSVMAHEAGHNVGPEISKINGFPMTEWEPTLSCLKKPESIHLVAGQQDEAIADFMAAEVIASVIMQLEPALRIPAVVSAMEPFCHFTAESDERLYFYPAETHPEDRLRVSGIYGGNSSLRKAMGCDKDSSQYLTCRMK